MVRAVVALALLLMAPVLAGCLEDDALHTFADLGAPRWEPGFNWTWESSTTGSYSFESEDGKGSSTGTHTSTITHRVVNTQEPVFGEAVYWIDADQGADSEGPMGETAFDRDGFMAIGQDDLQPVAYTHGFHFGWDDCAEETLRAYPADPFPLLRFPLEDGDKWSADEDDVKVTATVLGGKTVRVPAGTFDAVLVEVRVEAVPGSFDVPGEEIHAFSSVLRAWYSEAARNIVRLESHHTIVMEEEGDGRYEMEMDGIMELAAYSLKAGPQEAMPTIEDGSRGYGVVEPQRWQVASDRPFPLNAANGTNVSFWLMPQSTSGPFENLPAQDTVPSAPSEWLDTANETLQWEFSGAEDWRHSVQGEVVSVELPVGGHLMVHVRRVSTTTDAACAPAPVIMPMESADGESVMPIMMPRGQMMTWATLPLQWEQGFTVEHTGRTESSYMIPTIPVVNGGEVRVSYTVQDHGDLPDEGRLELHFPDGSSQTLGDDGSAPIFETGDLRIDWHAEGAGIPGELGVTFGHTVQGRILVVY